MSEKTVVIIEDEVDAADMFGEMMKVSGFRVFKSYTSKSALALVVAEHPDLVILDIMLPEISGLEILRKMRADPALAAIPVILLSAKSLPSDVKTGLEAGAALYLTKPVGFNELRNAAEQVVRASQST